MQKAAKSTPSDSDDHRFKLVWTSSRVRTNADRRIQKIVRTSFKIYHVRRRMSSDELQTRTFGRNVRQFANSSGRDAQLIANSSTPNLQPVRRPSMDSRPDEFGWIANSTLPVDRNRTSQESTPNKLQTPPRPSVDRTTSDKFV